MRTAASRTLLLLLEVCLFGASVTRPTDEAALQAIIDQMSNIRIGDFIRDMSSLPRNTQSEWMGQKEDTVREMFKGFGMEVLTKKYRVLQCFPQDTDPSVATVLGEGDSFIEEFREDGDRVEKILPAYNAWSDSGTIQGEPVYVNYARKEDFEHLKSQHIDITGKIGIARYGKIYRGDKAKFGKAYGLAGLIMYMDAADYSPDGVEPMPDGPGLPDTGVQRGTLKDGNGDPSTYLWPSTKYAYHEDMDEIRKRNILPGIIVMPTNFKNALTLLKDLGGDDVADSSWNGAGDGGFVNYKYGPGFREDSGKKELKISVNLDYRLVDIEDIFGVVKGQQEPDRWVMMGNHRDTWVHGAVDATTGLAALNEIGHGLGTQLAAGWRPRRTIVLASWGAEEQGIIGSTEFVEDYLTLLQEKMVAYINVDVAASDNKKFKPAATPNFRPLLESAARRAAPALAMYQNLYEQWEERSSEDSTENNTPLLKTLGSGSDYAAFIGMGGISSIDLTFVGPYYTYHTEYDNYDYLSKFADPNMNATRSVAEVAAYILFELANDRTVPLSATAYANYVKNTIGGSALEAELGEEDIDIGMFTKAIDKFVSAAAEYEARRSKYEQKTRLHVELRRFNDQMLQMERSFLYNHGLPGRPQNRHMLFAPSLLNSYSGSAFPGLFDCLEQAKVSGEAGDWNEVRKQLTIATWVTKAAARALSATVFPQ